MYCYNPSTGKLIAKVNVPAPYVTSCAFGGTDLDTLYITTARVGLSEEQLAEYPQSGNLFKAVVKVKGEEANCFK